MSNGKRAPAYGKFLLEARARGECNRGAVVIFGDDWSSNDDRPRICVKPAEFALDLFEWRYLYNLSVDIIDRDYRRNEIQGWPAIYWLAGEIANVAVNVRIWSFDAKERKYLKTPIDDVADYWRWRDYLVGKATGAPRDSVSWFPRELADDYAERCARYELEQFEEWLEGAE